MPDGFDAFVRALNPLLQSTQSKTRCDGLIRLGYSAQSASFHTYHVLTCYNVCLENHVVCHVCRECLAGRYFPQATPDWYKIVLQRRHVKA